MVLGWTSRRREDGRIVEGGPQITHHKARKNLDTGNKGEFDFNSVRKRMALVPRALFAQVRDRQSNCRKHRKAFVQVARSPPRCQSYSGCNMLLTSEHKGLDWAAVLTSLPRSPTLPFIFTFARSSASTLTSVLSLRTASQARQRQSGLDSAVLLILAAIDLDVDAALCLPIDIPRSTRMLCFLGSVRPLKTTTLGRSLYFVKKHDCRAFDKTASWTPQLLSRWQCTALPMLAATMVRRSKGRSRKSSQMMDLKDILECLIRHNYVPASSIRLRLRSFEARNPSGMRSSGVQKNGHVSEPMEVKDSAAVTAYPTYYRKTMHFSTESEMTAGSCLTSPPVRQASPTPCLRTGSGVNCQITAAK